MVSIINALDSHIPIRAGENNHSEFNWSKDLQEKIVQFDFQCVRTDNEGILKLTEILDSILIELTTLRNPEKKELLITLYKIIGKTRDINGGKGEYAISYMMIFTWYKYFPDLATSALLLFVIDPNEIDSSNDSVEPYGSWKDMKYFCKYVFDQTQDISHPLIQFCIETINIQLRDDDDAYNSQIERTMTLVAKWVPREESGKFGFLYKALATNYFPHYLASVKSDESKTRAIKKCKTQYRMICSKLNRHLDTVQIKQAGNCWAKIDHAKTTSLTMVKQRKAFMNITRVGKQRSELPDRVKCAENLRAYFTTLTNKGKEMKGKNIGFNVFAGQALELINNHGTVANQEEVDALNSQWRDNSNKKNAAGLGSIVGMVDLSGSMRGDPLHAAIALGCRVAEKSILGRRVLTFSKEPAWINLDRKDTFTDMVATIMAESGSAGLNTNFFKALDMILSAIEQHRIPIEEVDNMILAIFSDMQIDDNLSCMNGGSYGPDDQEKAAARENWRTMFQNIEQKYADTGVRMYGKPFNPPHILFWNLRKTNGFPTLSTEVNCSMMSGFDPTILNMFCDQGIEFLRGLTPYNMLMKQLDNPRYIPLDKIIRRHLSV